MCSFQFAMCSVKSSEGSVQCLMCTLQCPVYSMCVKGAVFIEQFAVSNVFVCTVQCEGFILQCAFCSGQCAVCTSHFAVCNAQFTACSMLC